jgi:FtsH-binding integral membrane protein
VSTLVYRSASQINDAMFRVYGNMFAAVVISMIASWVVSTSPALMQFLFTGAMKWVVILSPLVAVMILSFGIERLTTGQAFAALYGFSTLMGISFATIFVVFTADSIITAFMGAAVLFGTLSLYGYFTRRDLTSIGQFMFIGLIAIIIASVINIFIGSSVMQTVISAIAIIVFLGLTAYDTQRIREMVSVDRAGKNVEILGALSLYLNFINIFLHLLQLFGNRQQ